MARVGDADMDVCAACEAERLLVAADMAGAVVGCVHIGRLMSLDADLSGQILGLVVAERVRRQGVGRALKWSRVLR